MKLAVTIDVEEEGLFQGRYASGDAQVQNVGRLELLDPMFRDLGIRPTMLAAFQVARHPHLLENLVRLAEAWQGEVGAHLHPWNTPPEVSLPFPEPVPSDLIPVSVLQAKLEALLEALAQGGVQARSFRMGRFNLTPRIWALLESTDIRVDSSIAPMRRYYGGPDHLSASLDPYFPDSENLLVPGKSSILEAPLTILPLWPNLGRQLEKIEKKAGLPSSLVSWTAKHLLSLPAQPQWTGLGRLKAAVRGHRRRGGKVLTIFFHSSELIPGGCPQHPGEKEVACFLKRLNRFFTWLIRELGVQPVTLAELNPPGLQGPARFANPESQHRSLCP